MGFELGKQQTEALLLAKEWLYNDYVTYDTYKQIIKTDPDTKKKPWFGLYGAAGTGVSARII